VCDNLLILNDLNESYIAASVDLMLLVLFRAFMRCVLLHCAQCIVIGPVCVCVCVFVCLWVCLFVGLLPR